MLHLSESAAYNRIEVARVARKFPVVLEKLAEGSIHLSAIRTLAPCLTPENHLALLEAAEHKSKEEVERIVVTVRPRPDVPSVIRKLPEPAAPQAPMTESGTRLFEGDPGQAGMPASAETVQPAKDLVLATPTPDTFVPETPVPRMPPRRPAVSALSPGRYKFEFTADAETHEAFRQLQELLRHQVPNGDPAVIFKKALLLLLEKVRREKLAQVKRPRRRKAEVRAQRASRHIPAEVKRLVWERDQERCTFVGGNGRRCTERKFLEFHHVHAYALGGPATIDNIALRCRAHNAHESRLLFAGNGKKLTCPRTSCTTKKGCTHSFPGTSAHRHLSGEGANALTAPGTSSSAPGRKERKRASTQQGHRHLSGE